MIRHNELLFKLSIEFNSEESDLNLTSAIRNQQLGLDRLKWSRIPQNFFLSYLTRCDHENRGELTETIETILNILRQIENASTSNLREFIFISSYT